MGERLHVSRRGVWKIIKSFEVIEVGINVVVNAHAIMKKIEQPEEVGGYDHWQMKLEKRLCHS